MILQKPMDIEPGETAGELHDRLMEFGSDLVLETVGLIAEGNTDPKPQPDNAELKPAPKSSRAILQP